MIVQKELFGEGKHVEFKAEIPKKHEKFLKDIIAFANTSGGKTIVGVEDETGEVIGLGEQNPFKLSDAISNMISDSCTPQIYTEITAKTIDEHTILVTNSSTLLPSMFEKYTGCPERYLAMHFANTIWKNNTAEIMGHPGTSEDAYNKIVEFAGEIGMVPLCLHKEQPGYILNSMLVPFLNAAQALWANEVADPQTIDKTWEIGTGAPAGPFKILDIVGLETAYNINLMNPKTKEEGSINYKIDKLLKEKIDKGETGVNAGKGFYDYKK